MEANLNEIIYWTEVSIAWYLSGMLLLIGRIVILKGELSVKDIKESFGSALAGPLLIVGYIFVTTILTISAIIDKISLFLSRHENHVIWRSKKNRNKHILFGEDNNDKN